ncbi:DUF6056 family protein [Morganella morganii]|uniref:DUF6056 family protein n=1 Tax=Morganella morganii TaxID=582 RepID=UPI001898D816|nr:DUF6056 family protein [Morganella morganii]
MILNNKKILLLIISYFLFSLFLLNLFTPLQSDDYGYSLMGFNIEKHLHHYLTWSGRLVADFTSPLLLHIKPKIVQSIIQTIGVFILLVVIVSHSNRNKTFLLSFISIVFFISHPSFAQSNLWIVGSANYLWTAIIYSFFIYGIIKSYNTGIFPKWLYFISPLAGCTNENASLAIIGFLLLIIGVDFIYKNKIDKKYLILFILLCIGASILILSPGNTSRLSVSAFDDWRNLSLTEKLGLHFTERFPNAFKNSRLAYFISLTLIIISVINNKKNTFFSNKKLTATSFSIIFLAMGIGSNAILAFSPSFAERTMTPSFIFILFSISYSLHDLLDNEKNKKAINYVFLFTTIIYLVQSLWVINTYYSISKQNKFRIDIINRDQGEVLIPEFYFNSLPSDTYIFDKWTNFDAMRLFYNKEKFIPYDVGFDFHVINDNNEIIPSQRNMETENGLISVYTYGDKLSLDTYFVIEVTHQERLSPRSNNEMNFSVQDIFGNEKVFNFEPKYVYVDNRVFIIKQIPNTPKWLISNISFGRNDLSNTTIHPYQININI